MCRNKEFGGRRCYHGTEYERVLRNLKARKQYHTREGNTAEAEKASEQIKAYESSHQRVESLGEATLHPMTIDLSDSAVQLLTALRQAGFTPYVVGGTVRDALTQKPIKDVDIEVYNADPEPLLKALKRISPHVDEVGQQFGVLKVQLGGEEFDVSLPRTENRTGASHTSFEVETGKDLTVQEASARRDFTVNALLYDDELKHIIDVQGGLNDWKGRTLKHVSDAFDEDPLRVLRGAQMAARFNMELHPDTIRKAETLSSQFPSLAKERVQMEFQKLFTKSFHPEKGFKVLKDTKWDRNFPGLADTDTDALLSNLAEAGRTARKQSLDDDSRAVLFGAVTASHIAEQNRRDFLSYITVGDRLKNLAYTLATSPPPENTEDSTLRHWAKNAPTGVTLKDWARVQKIVNPHTREHIKAVERQAKRLNVWDSYEPDLIKGDTLMEELGQTRNGRWVGEALRKLREAQYSNQFRTYQEGLEWLKSNKEDLIP